MSKIYTMGVIGLGVGINMLPLNNRDDIPINMYNLHKNLGNSNWIVTTVSLVIVVPVVYLVLF